MHKDFPYITSTYPRFAEGARYYMQWAGVPDSVYSPTAGKDDYRDDYVNRGMWVNYMSGGSSVNPDEKGLNIPIDLSMAFHSDAGTYKDNHIVGTLGIYSTKKNMTENSIMVLRAFYPTTFVNLYKAISLTM